MKFMILVILAIGLPLSVGADNTQPATSTDTNNWRVSAPQPVIGSDNELVLIERTDTTAADEGLDNLPDCAEDASTIALDPEDEHFQQTHDLLVAALDSGEPITLMVDSGECVSGHYGQATARLDHVTTDYIIMP